MNTALRLVLSLTLAAGLIALLLHWSGTAPGEILAALRELDLSVYWTALGVQLLIYPLRALRLRILLPREHSVSTARLLPISAAHILAANVLPAKLGEASLVLYLRRVGSVPAANGLAVLLVSRVLDFATLTGTLGVACLVLGLGGVLPEEPWLTTLGLGLGLIALLLTWLASRGDRIVSSATGTLSLLHLDRTSLGTRLMSLAQRLREALAAVDRRQLTLAGTLTLPIWFLVFTFYATLARGLGITDLSFLETIFGSGLAILANLAPVNGFAGFGVQDMGWAAGFTALGVTGAVATSTGLAAHLVYLFNISVLGAVGHVLMGTRTPAE